MTYFKVSQFPLKHKFSSNKRAKIVARCFAIASGMGRKLVGSGAKNFLLPYTPKEFLHHRRRGKFYTKMLKSSVTYGKSIDLP